MLLFSFQSDLKKTTVVVESLSNNTTNVLFQRIPDYFKYYDCKIGAVNLKPGDLVLVKVDAFKGKRKIRDRWEEETCEVVCQIPTDVASYKVMDQHGWSCNLHQNQLLIASEVGIPLCIGSVMHGTDVPAPPHASPLLKQVKM